MFQDVSRELLAQGYRIRFRPGGRSMQPAIRDGEAITVAPVRAEDVRRGEILLYGNGKSLIAHRVVNIEVEKGKGRRFILRGDSCLACDPSVAARDVLGRVVSVEREGRHISLAGRRAVLRHDLNLWATKIRRRLAPRLKFVKLPVTG